MRPQIFAVVAALLLAPHAVAGQTASPAAPPCDYAACALNVVPAWNGLAVVRGADEERVALLGFFRARALDHVFAGDTAALMLARRAVRTRRIAAALTDLGAVLLVTGATLAITDDGVDGTTAALLAAGAVSLGVSVPLQFAADGHLSRAVWRFNRRFARP